MANNINFSNMESVMIVHSYKVKGTHLNISCFYHSGNNGVLMHFLPFVFLIHMYNLSLGSTTNLAFLVVVHIRIFYGDHPCDCKLMLSHTVVEALACLCDTLTATTQCYLVNNVAYAISATGACFLAHPSLVPFSFQT